MTQEKKNGKIIAIITMIFLFGMISFVTNLAAPMGRTNSTYPMLWVCWETLVTL